MAEASLSVTWDDLASAAARVMGLDRESNDANPDVVASIKRGLRRFYYPPPVLGERTGHSWSFLFPEEQLTVRATVSGATDADAASVGNEDINDAGVFQTYMIGARVQFTASKNTYTIKKVDTSAGNWAIFIETLDSADSTTGLAFKVFQGVYPLPDAFGGILGPFTFDVRTGYPDIEIRAAHQLRQMRMDSRNVETYRPRFAAIQPRDTGNVAYGGASDATTVAGQRFEVMLWPIPDTTYYLKYRYMFNPNAIATGEYPLGGVQHGEAIIAAVQSVAEEFGDSPAGDYYGKFMRQLEASVAVDREANQTEYFGQNLDGSDERSNEYRNVLNPVTYNGVTY